MLSTYSPAQGCDAQLNALCTRTCPHAETHGELFARLDGSDGSAGKAWRCYAKSTLSADGLTFVGGNTYCTRHAMIIDELQRCLSGTGTVAVDAAVDVNGDARRMSDTGRQPFSQQQQQQAQQAQQRAAHLQAQQRAAQQQAQQLAGQQQAQQRVGQQSPPPPRPPEEWISFPRSRHAATPAPSYEHTTKYLELPPLIRIPSVNDCGAEMAASAPFWAASLYTSGYAHKAERLHVSCKAWGVCCSTSLVPDGTFEGEPEGSLRARHRLIATKPLFILRTLEASPLPLAWLDVDLEFHQWPSLFTPKGWLPTLAMADGGAHPPRDVLLWNWQANVSAFNGRRLKTASGVMWYNKTDAARSLLNAWAESMAYEANAAAPDDQTLDLLVNDDGWIDRCAFGWLPASYLRMMPRFGHVAPVLDHDRGVPVSGAGRNSPIKPVLPPKRR